MLTLENGRYREKTIYLTIELKKKWIQNTEALQSNTKKNGKIL